MEQIVLLGGDARMSAAGEALQRDGIHAACYWMPGHPAPSPSQLSLEEASAVILPIPALTAQGYLRTECPGAQPAWEELRSRMRPDCLLCGGKLQGLDWPQKLDLMTDEGFALANAVPAALAVGNFWLV